ncbi:hypothetical protein OpiT1DRAFT_00006 [Opitutaceae bacterium TAV1]|nr:hypothetical protein OpiT1DRAFT_00006 [Opitutaceae bacterium TAV1]
MKTRLTLATIALAIILSIIAFYNYSKKKTPEYSLDRLEDAFQASDISKIDPFITAKGRRVFDVLIQQKLPSDKPPTNYKQTSYISDGKYYFRFRVPNKDGTDRYAFVFEKHGDYWHFDDVYIETVGDIPVGFTISYMLDNPNKAGFRLGLMNALAIIPKLLGANMDYD